MALTAELLREELESEEKRLVVAKRKREDAERDEKALAERVAALRTLLGKGAVKEQQQSSADGESGTSQREYMRSVLADSGTKGMKPADLYRAVKKYGVKRAYVHSTLFRWKEAGIVAEQNGKYSLTSVQ